MVSSAEAGYGKSHLIYKAVNNASASSRSLNLKIDNLQDFSFGDIFKAALRSLYEEIPFATRLESYSANLYAI